MRAKLKNLKKRLTGFTLVELLVVVGILAVLIAITLLAINPLEMINKAKDISTQTVAKDFASASKIYYTEEKNPIWNADQECVNELSSESNLSQMPSCINVLTKGGALQDEVAGSQEVENIIMSQCNDALALCHRASSEAFSKSSEARYTQNGALNPDCPGGEDCYLCTFTTNEAQECFQAMQPNPLSQAPTAQAEEVLPIIERDSTKLCNEPQDGYASCMADVVTDSSGTPLSTFRPPSGFTPEQLHKAYNLPCTPGGEVDHQCETPSSFGPQTVAVVLAYHAPTIEQDLALYSQTYGLPPCTVANGCLTIVNQNGQTSPLPTQVDSLWALEAALDVQMAHAICQTCKVLLVEANSNTFQNLGIATRTAAQMGATAISNSYGAREWNGASNYDQYYNHPGVGVTAATGDWGYGAYYPASSNKVIAVGGTSLSIYSDFSYASETVWNGTGSGCSAYQSVLSVQTSLPNWNSTGCGNKRSISDVAAVANPSTGVAVYNSNPYSGRAGWWILGGTSVSSPIYAGVLALQGGVPAGVDGATIPYQNISKHRDVISGSNGGCGNITCNAGAGYDGPTGLGSPNLVPDQKESPTLSPSPTITPLPTAVPTATPSPTLTPTPTGTTQNCTTQQTITLQQSDPVLALPGDIVNNVLTVKSNDTSGCVSLYAISHGYPTGWTIANIPASFTLTGGQTKTIPFTISVPYNASAGNYQYQFWVAKQGQANPSPVNGSIQVVHQGPTNTPTPTPINCFQGWSNSLGSTNMSGNAGDTLNQSITITYNNPPSCGTAIFAISHSYPSGWVINGLPPSVTLTGGQSVTVPFTITISTGAQIQDYILQYWVNSGGLPMNATVHVLGTALPPEEQMYSNLNSKMYGDYAIFEFKYNTQGAVSSRLDVATNPQALEQTSGTNSSVKYGFAFTSGHAWDSSNNPSPSIGRGFIVKTPQSWTGWQCGTTIYYRMYNSGDLRIKSPVQSGVVDCATTIDVLPWDPWYQAIYYGVYDQRYDADNNNIVNWIDYWMLVRATRLR